MPHMALAGSIVRVEENKRDVLRAPASILSSDNQQRFATKEGKVSNERVACSVYRHRVQVIVFPTKFCSYHHLPSYGLRSCSCISRGKFCLQFINGISCKCCCCWCWLASCCYRLGGPFFFIEKISVTRKFIS